MSLEGFPTEIDSLIVADLDHKELHALSLVSKYYRGIAEPFLYENVEFGVKAALGVKVLALTLMNRPELAKHVKRVAVYPGSGNGESSEKSLGVEDEEMRLHDELNQQFFSFLPQMENTMDLAWPTLFPNNRVLWRNTILAEGASLPMCTSLIITMAVNIEHLDVPILRPNTILASILRRSSGRPSTYGANALYQPFTKLKDFGLLGVIKTTPVSPLEAPLPYGAQQLLIQEMAMKGFQYPEHCTPIPLGVPFPLNVTPQVPFQPTLRVFELHKVFIAPSVLRHHVQSEYFGQLRRLLLSRVGTRSLWYSGNLPALARELTDHVPHLEELQFTIDWQRNGSRTAIFFQPDNADHPLGSLKGLTALTNLTLELGTLLNTLPALFRLPSTVLPDGLKALVLTDVKPSFLHWVADVYMKDRDQEVMARFISSMPWCKTLVLQAYRKPPTRIVEIFECIATRLSELGVDFALEWYDTEFVDRDRPWS